MEKISKESATVMFPAQINVYRVMLEMLDVLKEMATEWNGKVINKRFITAFEKRFPESRGRLRIDTDYVHPKFHLYISEGRGVQTSRGCCYVSESELRIYYGNEPYIHESDRRLNLERLNEILTQNVEYLNKQIADYEWCLEHYDEVKEQTKQLDKQLREFHDRIPRPLKPSTYFIDNPFEYFLHK